jgi:serine/threonine-protein kinase CTR1
MAKGSLRGVLKSSSSVTLSVEMRQNMALDCARGMRHLHSLGSIHRDLKSDNCLVDANLRVKVADFGESCLIRNAQSSMSTHSEEAFDVTANPSVSLTCGIGTPLWMAPELFSTSTKYGPEIDVYSFGVIMWELATLKEPWVDDIKEQGIQFCTVLIEAVVAGRRPSIPDNSEFSPTYVALLRKCWAGEPLDRPKFSVIVGALNPIS